MRSVWKKISLSAIVIGAFVVYAVRLRSSNPSQNNTNSPSTGSDTTSDSNSAQSGTTSGSVSYKDGTYTGDSTDAFYGKIQAVVTVSGGRITSVDVPVSPNDQQNSIQINSEALPILKQEVIQAQKAQVSGVSGATQSSQAFVQSVQSALGQAQT